jgi:hypothetical protein
LWISPLLVHKSTRAAFLLLIPAKAKKKSRIRAAFLAA